MTAKKNLHMVAWLAAAIMSVFWVNDLLFAASRGFSIDVKTPAGKAKKIRLYQNSYALVVGNGTYRKGWDELPGALRDVGEVAQALKRNGFNVSLKKDLTRDSFNRVFGEFAIQHGQNADNRLLFYYAGHGHTQKMATGEELGYLVMVDAPLPEKNKLGFRLASVDMQSLVTQAKMIQARHVMFIFDSCFSGSILNLRERVVPEAISENVRLPVRQFITAGRANEPVPDHSVFKQAFLDLLEGRDREPIPDGYITGEELGLYLKNKVPQYNPSQHPQYGKIRDPRLDKGDFVFRLASSAAVVDKPTKTKGAFLSVESNIPGAAVFVDGRKVGATPLADVSVSAGEHHILVEKQGYEPYQRRIEFRQGRSRDLSVILDSAVSKKGALFVDTEPKDARIRILNIGPPYFRGIELDPGDYHVEVSAEGYETKKQWVSLAAGEDKTLDIRLKRVAVAQLVQAAGQKIRNSLGMEFVYIPPGTFMMGSAIGPSEVEKRYGGEAKWYKDEHPQHRVTFSRGFYMQTTEVTQGQWKAVMGSDPSHFKGDDLPVETVSWNDAQAFIQKLNQQEGGNKYRLPTEAEWEYACRAGTTTRFYFGDDESRLGEFAWYWNNSDKKTHQVGQKKPNAWGLHDMHGNVWEWCQDWYRDYPAGSVTDPKGPSGGSDRVLRGGSWSLNARNCRSAGRDWRRPVYRLNSFGFRLVLLPGQ